MSKSNKKLKQKLNSDFSTHHNIYDQHHLLWSRNKWNSGYAKQIRDHWFFRVDLPTSTLHKTIHDHIPNIPVPAEQDCKRIMLQVQMWEHMHPKLMETMSPSKRIKWLIGTISNEDSKTVKALEKQLKYLEESGY